MKIFCFLVCVVHRLSTLRTFMGMSTSKLRIFMGFLSEMGGASLGKEDPLEKEMATHSSILTWRIPWTEEPGKLQFMGGKESNTTECQTFYILLFLYFCVFVIFLQNFHKNSSW